MGGADFLKTESELEKLCQRVSEATDEKSISAALNNLSSYLTERDKQKALRDPSRPPPGFDVFCGFPGDRDAVWIATVRSLVEARSVMEKLAAERPAPYFIFYGADHSVLARIDTRPPKQNARSNVA